MDSAALSRKHLTAWVHAVPSVDGRVLTASFAAHPEPMEPAKPVSLAERRRRVAGASETVWGVSFDDALQWARERAGTVIVQSSSKRWSAGELPMVGMEPWPDGMRLEAEPMTAADGPMTREQLEDARPIGPPIYFDADQDGEVE